MKLLNNTSAKDVANVIAEKNIVALFQGQSESGRRSLGNRSILYDPRDPNGKDHVNTIKKREWYRPFACSILLEYAHEWFDMASLKESPYMMFAIPVLKHKQHLIPNVIHVDGTCRIQTVTKDQNENFYSLLKSYNDITGIPLLLNTSFNLSGESIVETEDEAIDILNRSDINYLYLPEKHMLCIS